MWGKKGDLLAPRNGYSRNVAPLRFFHELKMKSLFQFSCSLLILFILYYFLLLPSTSRRGAADEELMTDVVYAHKKSINEAVLITTTGFVQIPSSVVGEDNKMYYTKGGSGYPFFFMVIKFL
jgi:hypothetical protein